MEISARICKLVVVLLTYIGQGRDAIRIDRLSHIAAWAEMGLGYHRLVCELSFEILHPRSYFAEWTSKSTVTVRNE